jgi:hypothetical protein
MRHQEEMHNAWQRDHDIHDYHSGGHPDAWGHGGGRPDNNGGHGQGNNGHGAWH